MMTRFVIEGILVLAVICGFIFEEKIALAERKVLKKLFRRSLQKQQREARAKLMLREARYVRAQRERELELLELGVDPRPSLKVIAQSAPTSLSRKQEEVA